MTHRPTAATVPAASLSSPSAQLIGLHSSVDTESSNQSKTLGSNYNSVPAAAGEQQQEPPVHRMAVNLQTLPAAAGPGMGLGTSFRGGRDPGYSPSTYRVSTLCGLEAAHGSSRMVSEAMLTAALQPASEQQQYRCSSSTGQLDSPQPPAAAAAAAGGASSGTGAALLSRSSSQQSTPPAATTAAAAGHDQEDSVAAATGEGDGGGELPLLARKLGVTVGSLARLFRADAEAEFEQPVWMVVNLQGKIKGSYTAEKMLEFCRRGTLSAAQMVLGIDKNLPYVARQELAFYRPLGQLLVAVHAGAHYSPLTEAAIDAIAAKHLTPAHWAPLVSSFDQRMTGEGSSDIASDLCGLSLDGDSACAPGGSSTVNSASGSSGATSSSGSGEGRVVAAAAAARLRSALQRLCAVGHQGGRVGVGAKQPLWLYINHLGWCRGPFSGGKVMHAHLCGRLPRNTLMVAYDPELPACMISGDVGQWFRPLGALLDNVANGWTYNTVKWPDVVNKGAAGTSAGGWEPLVWLGPGSPPPLVAVDQLAPPATAAGAGGAAAVLPSTTMHSSGSGSGLPRPALPGQMYSTGSTLQGPVAVQAGQYSCGGATLLPVQQQQQIIWQQQQQQQQQQVMPLQPRFGLYAPADYQSGMMSNPTTAVEGMNKQSMVSNPVMMAMMQQQLRGVAMFPNSTPIHSWESGSFPASSSSNALPSTSLSSSTTNGGQNSLSHHANSGTASPNMGHQLATAASDSNVYSAGPYAAAAAARSVDSSFETNAAAAAWWQQDQQQQQYIQAMGTGSPFLAGMSSAELAGQSQSGMYMVVLNPNSALMRPNLGCGMAGYDVSSSPMLVPNCSVSTAAAGSHGGMMMVLQQQQQQSSSPIQQQQQHAAQQQYLMLDAQTYSGTMTSAGSGPYYTNWQPQ